MKRLKIREAAEVLGVTIREVRVMCEQGTLQTILGPGGYRTFDELEVKKLAVTQKPESQKRSLDYVQLAKTQKEAGAGPTPESIGIEA